MDETSSLIGGTNNDHYENVEHLHSHLQLSSTSYNSCNLNHDEINDVSNGDKVKLQGGEDDVVSTLASISGNILESYDFAIYGYFADIIGWKFFPPSTAGDADNSTIIIESFLVFGGAFIVRPVGGIVMGMIGDSLSRKRALEISLFLMSVPTFTMGCLPTFQTIGWYAVALLVTVRLLQGLSFGGQLMTSAVFVAEGHHSSQWGYFGSLAMTSANCGTLLGGVVGYVMRRCISQERIINDGLWRIPFLCGIFVSLSGFYLKHHVNDHDQLHSKGQAQAHGKQNPLQLSFSKSNITTLLCATASVALWSGGFYIIFVWLAICMTDLQEHTVSNAFGINAISLFISMILLFPYCGWLSDRYGRKLIMSIGALGIAVFSPPALKLISTGETTVALLSQLTLGVFLALYGSPLCAFLIERFPPEYRLTSVAVGYNTSMAIVGGLSPSLSTWLTKICGVEAVGYLLSTLATISLCGLHLTPKHNYSY